MRKKLLVVGVAATLGAMADVNRAALLGLHVAPTQPNRSNDPWADGGSGRSKRRYRRHQLSAAARLLESAKSRRVSGL